MKNKPRGRLEVEVGFHRLAAEEFREARRWYERRRPGTGDDFRAEVDRATGQIKEHPERQLVFREHYRRIRLRRFPFALYYLIIDPTHILILAVAHAKRRPGYWLRRKSP